MAVGCKPEHIELCRVESGEFWLLGSGAFGKVYRAVWNGLQNVAVKFLIGQSDELLQKFEHEITILKSCRSPHVVQFLGACMQPGCIMLVTELMEGGTLRSLLVQGNINWRKQGCKIAADVARGLAYLHTQRIVHLDVKSGNVLLTSHGTAKVADVGLADIIHNTYLTIVDIPGTFSYAAPELLSGGHCSEKADVFSMGVLLWEIITMEPPRRGKLREIRVPEECDQSMVDLVDACMRLEPSDRPTMRELVPLLDAEIARNHPSTSYS